MSETLTRPKRRPAAEKRAERRARLEARRARLDAADAARRAWSRLAPPPGETFARLLSGAGIGAWQLAQEAGVGHQSICRWIRGQVAIRTEQAAAVATALGITTQRVLDAAERSRAAARRSRQRSPGAR